MKQTLLIFLVISSTAFSQNVNNSLSVLGGGEYHNARTHAWDIELNYNRRFHSASRWSSEFGLNFSILEYKGDTRTPLNTSEFIQAQHGSSGIPDYSLEQRTHYSKTTALRLQAGVNYTIFDKTNWNLSGGLNVVNELVLRYYEHGQRVHIPMSDTLDVIDIHYTTHQRLKGADNAISIQIQPHVDMSVRLAQNLWFTSRVAYYARLFSRTSHSRGQLLLGVRYAW